MTHGPINIRYQWVVVSDVYRKRNFGWGEGGVKVYLIVGMKYLFYHTIRST